MEKLLDPIVLAALFIAFLLGRFARPTEEDSLSPPPLTAEEKQERLDKVTSTQWATIDSALRNGKKIEAIKLLREASSLGLKNSKEAVEERAKQRGWK